MHHARISGARILLVGLIAGVGLVGCGKKPPEENQAAIHLRMIANAYNEVNYRHKRSPRSVEELKPILQEMGVEDPDAYLRSPNDGEPYEIVWGINLERVSDGGILVAYEKKGVNGKRYAINAARIVKQLTDAEIEQASPSRGKKPAGG
ncbi:MAG TPA: hypothetical protein VNK04_22785 [Gemmataceae bacterium]|jgi:hypothetical protein|nr:hypothetical protein [Gemmataceae bacterium]